VVGDSWTHKIARVCVIPLVGTAITPSHLTAVRLVTGLAACGAFAVGERSWDIWGGWLWLLSAFLDRADGELARVGNMMTEKGHKFDYFSDATVTSLFFAGVGFGLRDGMLGTWAIALGLAGAAGVAAAEILSERIDQAQKDTGEKAYPGIWGFDFDDVLYLFAPVVWLGWQMPLMAGAALGAPAFAVLTWFKWRAVKLR
jgi:archaetidylinositol phosphate synthase